MGTRTRRHMSERHTSDGTGPRGRTLRDSAHGAPRRALGRLVRRSDRQPSRRRDDRHQRCHRGSGGAPWPPPARARPGPAAPLGRADRDRYARSRPTLSINPRKGTDMATTARTAVASRGAFDPTRKTALVAGILYLLTFASSIPAALLLGSALSDPNYILGAGADGQVRVAATPRHRQRPHRHRDRGRALLRGEAPARGLRARLRELAVFEAAILFIGVVSVLSIAILRETAAAAADPASLVAVGTRSPPSTRRPSCWGPASLPSTPSCSAGCCSDLDSCRARFR